MIETPNPGLVRRFLGTSVGKKIAGGALVAGVAAKIVMLDKYKNWRASHQRRQQGLGIGPARFAGLPRRRQQSILYYKRSQLGALENVYGLQQPLRRRGGTW